MPESEANWTPRRGKRARGPRGGPSGSTRHVASPSQVLLPVLLRASPAPARARAAAPSTPR